MFGIPLNKDNDSVPTTISHYIKGVIVHSR